MGRYLCEPTESPLTRDKKGIGEEDSTMLLNEKKKEFHDQYPIWDY
jgi:hypothetical protein